MNMTQCERQADARIVRQAIDPALAGIPIADGYPPSVGRVRLERDGQWL